MQKCINIGESVFELLIEEAKIQKRVKELARQISYDYKNTTPVFIGILNGSFIFLADLIRELDIDCEVDFIKIASYGNNSISKGQIILLKNIDNVVKGRDVIIVEDVVDSGSSVRFIKELISSENPKSLKFVSLLLKKGKPDIDFQIDYICFEIGADFVVGYGLDYAQKVRNLRSIYKQVP